MDTRRAFLKLLAATAASMAFDPFRGVSASEGEYRNARLGLRVGLPDGWEFSSIADFAALRERQVLQDVLDHLDEESQTKTDPDDLPAFIFEQPEHREGHFAPGIALYDEQLKRPPLDDKIAAHNRIHQYAALVYKGVRVLRPTTSISLHGAQGTLSRWSYVHEIDTGEMFWMDVRTVLVFRPPRVLTFYMVDSMEAPRIEHNVWIDLIDSIHFESA